VIDAVTGDSDAVVRESADLLYNLTVLWASAGVQPEDVWREMERREHMLGIGREAAENRRQNGPRNCTRLRRPGSDGDQLSRLRAAI